MSSLYTAIIYKEEMLFVAECPEVGTVSQGETLDGGPDDAQGQTGGAASPNRMAQRDALSLPLVKQVLDVFDATLVDARVDEQQLPDVDDAAVDDIEDGKESDDV